MYAPEFRERLLVLLNRGVSALVIDLTSTEFCDSSGLGVVLRARRRAVAIGTPMGLLLPSDGQVRKIFQTSGVIRVLPNAPTLAELINLM
jgi:anti-sigma B factor antagonist